MKKQVLIFIVLTFSTFEFAQAQNIRIQAPPGYNYIYTDLDFPSGTEGSPYLDEWQKAEIVFRNGQKFPELMVRYNVYTNQMLFQHSGKTFIIGAPDSIAEIKFRSRTFVYREYIKGNKLEKSYFEIAVPGKVALLYKYEIEMIRANYNVALNIGNKNNRLELRQHQFLMANYQLTELTRKSKPIIFFSDKNKEISEFMDKEGLSFKTREELVKIVSYYNGLF